MDEKKPIEKYICLYTVYTQNYKLQNENGAINGQFQFHSSSFDIGEAIIFLCICQFVFSYLWRLI